MIEEGLIDWAARVAAVLDPVTSHRLGGDVKGRIVEALESRSLPHLSDWWQAQASLVIDDALTRSYSTASDGDVVHAAACSVVAVALSQCPLDHAVVRDVLSAVLAVYEKECGDHVEAW